VEPVEAAEILLKDSRLPVAGTFVLDADLLLGVSQVGRPSVRPRSSTTLYWVTGRGRPPPTRTSRARVSIGDSLPSSAAARIAGRPEVPSRTAP
jgi:hypothetical protein